MLEQLGYVKETISLRENDITGNEFETNNLLMDDILLALGYNKRRDRGVRAVYTPGADWEIAINGNPRFIISVYGYKSEEPSVESLGNTFAIVENQMYPFAVITDGQKLFVYKNETKIISIEDIFDGSSDEVLTALSKDGWNPKFIERYQVNSILTDEIIKKALDNDVEDLIDIVENSGTLITIDVIFSRVAEFIKTNAISDSDNTKESEEAKEDKAEAIANEVIEQLKLEIDALKKENETLVNDRAKLEDKLKNIEITSETIQNSDEYKKILGENTELNEKVAGYEKEIEALNSELNNIKAGTEQIELDTKANEEVIEALKSANIQLQTDKEAALAELAKLVEERKSIIDTNVSLENGNQKLIDENNQLKSDLETLNETAKELKLRVEGEVEKLAIANFELNTVKSELGDKDAKIDELSKKLDEIAHTNITPAFNGENEYRAKIEELTAENQMLKMELNTCKAELTEIKKKQDEAEDERVVLARQLLDAIEDHAELERTYVGVVNSKLFQINELSKFVGSCLQELYSAVSFELMQLLFDGDIFVLKQTTDAGDLMLNARNYILDFGELSEEEILSRLSTLFGKFDQVVFNYKVIGNKAIKRAKLNLVKDNEEAFAEAFGTTVTDTFEEEEPEIIAPKEDRKLLGLALVDVSGILWSENNPIKALAAIGDNSKLFKVDSYNMENTIRNSIDSLLNISPSVQAGIQLIRNTDLSTLSNVIHLNKNSDTDVRIFDTNYYIEETSQQKIISAVLAVAELLQLDNQQVYMYFEADYIEDWNDFYAIESSLNLDNKFNIEETEENGEVLHCILSGTVVDFIQTIDGILDVENQLIEGTLAARTKYLQKSLRNIKDVGVILSEILAKTETPEIVIEAINKSGLYNKKIILTEEEIAGMEEESLGIISTGAAQYYITELPASIITLVVMMAHREITGDSIIDIRIALNSRLYTAYISGIMTSDSREYLLSRLMVEVTNGKVRSISK